MRPVIPTAAELLALLKARLDQYQVDGWDGRSGAEFYAALAEVASAAIGRAGARLNGRLIREAAGAARAAGSVTVTWAGATADAVGLAAGQVVVRTPWGVTYELAAPVERAAGAAAGSVTAPVAARWSGPEGNAEAAHLNTWALPGGVDPAASIAWTGDTTPAGQAEFLAGVAAGTITISGATDATGGADGLLDLIGAGRGMPRAAGEADAAYRVRLAKLPDIVTPAAILRAVNAALAPWGVTATMAEPWEYGWAPGRGAIGRNPPSRPWHFVVLAPSIPHDPPGWCPGQRAFNRAPIGTPDTARAGFYAGLEATVNRTKAAGIWASVRESTA